MSPSLWRAALVGLAAGLMPFTAAAQLDSCRPELTNTSYMPGEDPNAARLRCDLERAASIRDRAAEIYGVQFDSLIEIIDTASPSGAAYVYDVLSDGGKLRLEARSVPDGRGPRCRMQATLPDDTANAVSGMIASAADPQVPGYGPREEVTTNPDGSRSVRLVIDSHDIITRAQTAAGTRTFSRHSGSDDAVNALNQLVIGVANVSPGWVCKTS